jgi:repressor LexA
LRTETLFSKKEDKGISMSKTAPADASKTQGGPQALTERQEKVLHFIEKEIARRGFPPTIREIGGHLGIRSTNGVNDHLRALQRKGYITREGQKSRTLKVLVSTLNDHAGSAPSGAPGATDPMSGLPDNVMPLRVANLGSSTSEDMVDVPLLGRVAAGAPILAYEEAEDTVQVSSFFLGRGKGGRVFALRVVGDSMIEDGILDGDFIFVKNQPAANAGDIVVAMLEGEATVKRYFPEGDRIRFQPANSRMEPIFVKKSDFRSTALLGIVVGVYRKL